MGTYQIIHDNIDGHLSGCILGAKWLKKADGEGGGVKIWGRGKIRYPITWRWGREVNNFKRYGKIQQKVMVEKWVKREAKLSVQILVHERHDLRLIHSELNGQGVNACLWRWKTVIVLDGVVLVRW